MKQVSYFGNYNERKRRNERRNKRIEKVMDCSFVVIC